MKKMIGIILMVVSGLFFCLLIAAEVKLFQDGTQPKDFFSWVGNLIMPLITVGVFFLGNKLRKQ